MNNAEYFSKPDKMGLREAFGVWARRRGWKPEAMVPNDALGFAAANAMTTLEWNVGDVVQVALPGSSYHGKYATVDSFGESAYMMNASESEAAVLYLRVAGGNSRITMYAHHVRKPDFPPGLVELVKSQMRASCPLKEPGCLGTGREECE